MGARVGGGLVEADAGHRAGRFGGELHADLDRRRVSGVGRCGRGGRAPDRAWAGDVHGRGGPGYEGGLQVGAVVDGARLDRRRGVPCWRSRRRTTSRSRSRRVVSVAGCQVEPPSVETSTPATTPPPVSVAVPVIVTALPSGSRFRAVGEVIVEVGGVVSVDFVGGHETRVERPGLGAHVGQQVDGRLLHVGVGRAFARLGRGPSQALTFAETPRPLHGAGAEHQRSAGGLVERQVVGGRWRSSSMVLP